MSDPERIETRSLVVSDRSIAIGLTKHGIAACAYTDIAGQPDEAIVGYFHGEPANVLVVKNAADERKAQAVANRLRRLAVPVRVARPDRRHT